MPKSAADFARSRFPVSAGDPKITKQQRLVQNGTAPRGVWRRCGGWLRARLIGLLCLSICCGWIGWAYAFGLLPSGELLFTANEFPSGWVHYCSEKDAPLQEVWKVEKGATPDEDILICNGKLPGYIRTRKPYKNFSISMEWKYPSDPNANSGVLIHTSGDDKIWPKSIQVQLHRPTAGSIFPTGGGKSANTLRIDGLKLPVNQWHRCVITCREGTVAVSINDKKTGEVTGCDPQRGCIALQSEGQEIHFRRISLVEL